MNNENSNEFIANLTFSFTSCVPLWDRPCYENMLIYDRKNKLPKTYDNIKLYDSWLMSRYRLSLYTLT